MRLFGLFLLGLLLVVGFAISGEAQNKLLPFTSDGCSRWLDYCWLHCCYDHDKKYWVGGTQEEKNQADNELYECVKRSGHSTIATLMRWGVDFGGSAKLNSSFKWGYGWVQNHGYEALKKADKEQINKFLPLTELPIQIRLIVMPKMEPHAYKDTCEDEALHVLTEKTRIDEYHLLVARVEGKGGKYRLQIFSDTCPGGYFTADFRHSLDTCLKNDYYKKISPVTVLQGYGECATVLPQPVDLRKKE